MFPDLLKILRCPVDSGEIVLEKTLVAEDGGEVYHGILLCKSCNRWFRVEKGIVDLVRDALRDVNADRRFLEEYKSFLSAKFLESGRPFAMGGAAPAQSSEDIKIIEEGIHWGRFMRRFWDVGDRSIFDIRIKGTHPPFYVAGILETDDRDSYRRYGIFPDKVGRTCFERLGKFRGKRGIDVGCGGGQFGLEAARQGVQMVGFDPSFEELLLARRHAREQGIENIDYVRAEPANAPFRKNVFSLMMAKDSLHHVPDLENVFPKLVTLMKYNGLFICHEHTNESRIKSRLMKWLMPRAINKIRSRYAKYEIPAELLKDSANEDVGADKVREVVRKAFKPSKEIESLYLANEMEMMIHFAFGKRRWLSLSTFYFAAILEELFLFMGDRQHFTFVGRLKEKNNSK